MAPPANHSNSVGDGYWLLICICEDLRKLPVCEFEKTLAQRQRIRTRCFEIVFA